MNKFMSFLIVLALASTPALAGPGKGKGAGGNGPSGKGNSASQGQNHNGQSVIPIPDPTQLGGIFSDAAKSTIRGHYQANPGGLKSLPPGIAKNLARGKPLPPGIAKQGIGEGLQTQLPEFPGYELLLAGDNVLMVDIASQLVTDVLYNVLN